MAAFLDRCSSLKSNHDSRLAFYFSIAASVIAAGILSGHAGSSTHMISWTALFAIPMVIMTVGAIAWRPSQPFFLSPAGVSLGYLWVSVLLVPILWGMGLATPWSGTDSNSMVLLGSGFLSVLALTLGVAMTGKPNLVRHIYISTEGGLSKLLLIGLGSGLSALVLLGAATGGFGALLSSLAMRRDVLSGLGPISAFASVPGAAVILALLAERKSAYQKMLMAGCALAFVVFYFLSGSRFPIVAFAAAMIISRAQRGRISWTPVALLGITMMPFCVWYAYSIRQKLSYGSSEASIDGSSVSGVIRSIVDPFVEGGLDTLRTTGVAVAQPQMFAFNWEGMLGGFLTVVPREMWENKPYGVSIAFSREYFPERWLAGTGVPPSMPAEVIFYVGLVFAPLVLIGLGFAVGRISQWLWTSPSLPVRVISPLITMDTVVLVKSGSDSFIRLATIHVIGVLLVTGLSKRLGIRVRTIEHG